MTRRNYNDKKKYRLCTLGKSFVSYYKTINNTYFKHFNKYLMLHYPFYLKENESLEKRQKNLIDYCINKLNSINSKTLLDIGSGNGTVCVYVYDNYTPNKIICMDVNEDNVNIAKQIVGERNIELKIDDAESMLSIPDNTIDVAICIESAFHYQNKDAFLQQLNRVLKRNGEFIIADIITKSHKRRILLGRWKHKMRYFHWTENEYEQGIRNAGFSNFNIEDITKDIVKGYSGHKNWEKEIISKSIFNKLIFYLITFVQVNLNIYLLIQRRKYLIIKGRKN